MDEKEKWGRHVVAIRAKHNLSQDELAAQIGTNQATISRWERFLSKPTYRFQKEIASRYGEPTISSDLSPLEPVYDIAQAFVNARSRYTMVYDRDFILRASNVPLNKRAGAQCGRHMSKIADPWEAILVDPFADLLGDITFWDSPDTCWVYHKPHGPGGIDLIYTFRLILTCIEIMDERFLFIHNHYRVSERYNEVAQTTLSAPEPFDPRPWELHLPVELLRHALEIAQNQAS